MQQPPQSFHGGLVISCWPWLPWASSTPGDDGSEDSAYSTTAVPTAPGPADARKGSHKAGTYHPSTQYMNRLERSPKTAPLGINLGMAPEQRQQQSRKRERYEKPRQKNRLIGRIKDWRNVYDLYRTIFAIR